MVEPFEIVCRKTIRTINPSPINFIAFSSDGKYLLTGGDDAVVRVWDTSKFECIQILENTQWGQITALTFINNSSQNHKPTFLCVGCGRGCVSIIPTDPGKGEPFLHTQSVTLTPFNFNDSVELQAYDEINSRLAVASHGGQLKMYRVEKSPVSLEPLWSANLNNLIPGGMIFHGDSAENVLVIALETSEIYCREASSGSVLWKNVLIGGVGGVSISSDGTSLLVNNLSTGKFDLYHLPLLNSTPARSLPINPTHNFNVLKHCHFLRATKLSVCGTDSNKVIIVDTASNEIVKTLITGKANEMTQAVAASPEGSTKFFIAGSSGGVIYVWEKLDPQPRAARSAGSTSDQQVQPSYQASSNSIILLVVVVLTYSNWSPYFLILKSIIESQAHRLVDFVHEMGSNNKN